MALRQAPPVDHVVTSPWYRAQDIMAIMEVCESKAYKIIKALQKEIVNTKIPGTDRCYAAPPAGRIRKEYFCEKYMLDVDECDAIVAQSKRSA